MSRTRERIALARDCVAVVEATLTGDQDRLAELVALLTAEPADFPFIVASLAQITGRALRMDSQVAPDLFGETLRAAIDDAEAAGGG